MALADLHVDHVGSLLRPAELKEKRFALLGLHDADHNLGAHANRDLTEIENGFIRDVVKLQEDCELPVVTDGDFRRRSWWTDFLLSFTGLSISYDGKTPITLINAAGEKRPIAGIKVTGKIMPRDSGMTEAFKFLKSVAHKPAKVTIPGPPIVHFLRDSAFVPSVHKDIDAFWSDLINSYRAEIRKVADAGCRYLQIDECMLPYLCDPRHREMSKLRGDDPDQ
jgi:5-methyltetrahydropteroyltriglutamate--homocysteine methyltransferase